MLPIADMLRALAAVEALALIPPSVYAISKSIPVDQKLRFAALALMGVVVVAWQIEVWGHPWHWRIPVMVVALSFALTGVALFLTTQRRCQRQRRD